MFLRTHCLEFLLVWGAPILPQQGASSFCGEPVTFSPSALAPISHAKLACRGSGLTILVLNHISFLCKQNEDFTLFLATAAAIGSVSASQHASIDLDTGDIDASSELGSLIMSKARALEQNNQQYMSWVSGYSIKFQQCFGSQSSLSVFFSKLQILTFAFVQCCI